MMNEPQLCTLPPSVPDLESDILSSSRQPFSPWNWETPRIRAPQAPERGPLATHLGGALRLAGWYETRLCGALVRAELGDYLVRLGCSLRGGGRTWPIGTDATPAPIFLTGLSSDTRDMGSVGICRSVVLVSCSGPEWDDLGFVGLPVEACPTGQKMRGQSGVWAVVLISWPQGLVSLQILAI